MKTILWNGFIILIFCVSGLIYSNHRNKKNIANITIQIDSLETRMGLLEQGLKPCFWDSVSFGGSSYVRVRVNVKTLLESYYELEGCYIDDYYYDPNFKWNCETRRYERDSLQKQ